MNEAVAHKIERLQKSYVQVKSVPFRHFFCPVLFRDEDVELCQAHIINSAFSDSARAWTIQRKDVDSFYGSKFESDFVTLQYRIDNWTPVDALTDKGLSKSLRPTLLVNDEPVEYFVTHGSVPDKFPVIQIENNGETTSFGLKMSPKDFSSVLDGHWEIEVNKNVALHALVSLIKSAHLTLFDLLGYHYALSAGGYFVGRQILGDFFLRHEKKSKTEVLEAAIPFFKEFVNMVRPLSLGAELQGTITDHHLFMCRNVNSVPWAFIVFLRTSAMLHAVVLPVFSSPDSANKFMSFLSKDQNTIEANPCRLTTEGWEISKEVVHLAWPDSGRLSL